MSVAIARPRRKHRLSMLKEIRAPHERTSLTLLLEHGVGAESDGRWTVTGAIPVARRSHILSGQNPTAGNS